MCHDMLELLHSAAAKLNVSYVCESGVSFICIGKCKRKTNVWNVLVNATANDWRCFLVLKLVGKLESWIADGIAVW